MRLYPFQSTGIQNLREEFRAGARAVLCVSPTGSGKTLVATEIVRRLVERQNRCLFLAHRKELIDQASKKLDSYGVDHGVIKSGHWRVRPWLPVQVASVPTLVNRLVVPEADLVILDEAHHATSESFSAVLKRYPESRIFGLTATPYRLDGRGLGEHFQKIVVLAQIQQLVDDGYLVPARTFAPSKPDLRGVSKSHGEFNRREVARAMDKPTLIGDIVKTWAQRGEGRTTVVFACSIKHSKHIVERFRAAGFAAEHVDGDTPDDERERILERVSSGVTTIVSNVQILTEGWDLPRVSCAVMARPTLSLSLWIQMAGRILRLCPEIGKHDALLFDHAGNSLRHGLITDPIEFTLEGVAKENKEKAPSLRQCKACFAISPGPALKCLECGREFPKKERLIVEKAGELKELQQQSRQQIGAERRVEMLANWIRQADAAGHKPMAPFMKFAGFFGAPVDEDTKTRALELARPAAKEVA